MTISMSRLESINIMPKKSTRTFSSTQLEKVGGFVLKNFYILDIFRNLRINVINDKNFTRRSVNK